MKAIDRRLSRLEDRFAPDKLRERLRMVVRTVGIEDDFETTTCSRTLWPNGKLFEMVHLNGHKPGSKTLSDEELDRWVESFPIE